MRMATSTHPRELLCNLSEDNQGQQGGSRYRPSQWAKEAWRSTKRLCKIQRGSLIGSYTRHMCFPSGPDTSKSSRHVRRITRPRCSEFCCVIWLSISFSCRASSALLLLIIFRATFCSDCHLSLNRENQEQFIDSQHEAGESVYGCG